jgi:hypothetical protein
LTKPGITSFSTGSNNLVDRAPAQVENCFSPLDCAGDAGPHGFDDAVRNQDTADRGMSTSPS